MSVHRSARVEDEVAGLLLSAWMGDEKATVLQVKRLQEALQVEENSPDRAIRRIFEVARRCYDLALGDGADVASGGDVYLALAASKMGAPYLRRALRSLSGAESSVRFGNDLGNELLVAFAELAGRGRSSPQERRAPGASLGDMTVIAVAPTGSAVADVANRPTDPAVTEPAVGDGRVAAQDRAPRSDTASEGVAVQGSEERDPEAERKLARGWWAIRLRVQKKGYFLQSYQFVRSKGFSVRGRVVTIYAKSPGVADSLKHWKENEVLAEEIRRELGRALDVRFTFDPEGTAPKMAAPAETR